MKKTLLAGMLFTTVTTTAINAKPLKLIDPDETKCFTYSTYYTTEKSGNCEITYKITIKYLFCIAISSSKQLISKKCQISSCGNSGGNPGSGSGTGSNKYR